MAERFNAPVLKTGDLKGSGGSNPSSSVIISLKNLFGVGVPYSKKVFFVLFVLFAIK